MEELNEGPNSDGMTYDEFLTWAAYVSIHPFPEERADVHVGMLMAQTYNMNRGKGKPTKKVSDFVPEWNRGSRPEMTVDQMAVAMRAQYLAMGGDPSKLS